jgi:arylsulfatase A-like enzyme
MSPVRTYRPMVLIAFKHHAPDVHTPNMDRLAARGILF